MRNLRGKSDYGQLAIIRAYFSDLGKVGGKASTERKRTASRESLKKARAVRMASLGKAVQS